MHKLILVCSLALSFAAATQVCAQTEARQMYNDAERRYIAIVTRSSDDMDAATAYVGEGDVTKACPRMRAARDGFVEAGKAATDMIRLDKQDGGDGAKGESLVTFTAEMEASLNDLIRERCK